MKTRERFKSVLSGKLPDDRLPIVEWSPWWDMTIDRWEHEGLPIGMNRVGIDRHMGLDEFYLVHIFPDTSCLPAPESCGAHITTCEADYDAVKEQIFSQKIIDSFIPQLKKMKPRQENDEIMVCLLLQGYFWFPRTILGIEPHLLAFYDEPEFMHKLNSDVCEFNQRAIKTMHEILTPDMAVFYEDMSYNLGPMLSKDSFDEFLTPYYHKTVPMMKQKGTKVFIDTDGNVEPLIPWFKNTGIEGVTPLERMAGVDVNRILENHPDYFLCGGFDKIQMSLGEEKIRAEFDRIFPAMKTGHYIVSCDHQTPPGVSYEDYKLYRKILEEYCCKAVEDGKE